MFELFAKHQPGVVGCGWLQPGRNFLSTYLEQIYTSLYRDALKGGPVLLSNSQAEPDRNFSQPRAHLLVDPVVEFIRGRIRNFCQIGASGKSKSDLNPQRRKEGESESRGAENLSFCFTTFAHPHPRPPARLLD